MNLVLAVTGASGALAASLLARKSPWPVTLIASRWAKEICQRERVSLQSLVDLADRVYSNDDLTAPVSSGSVRTVGMVILPCSTNTLARVAGGFTETLIARAAHCHLKERRTLVLCIRETPWTLMDIENARKVSAAGGIIMPLSPPFYMVREADPGKVSLEAILQAYTDRVLAVLGDPAVENWETVR